MATWACRKTRQVLDNVPKILGIEAMLAAKAIFLTQEALGGFQLGAGSQALYDLIKSRLPLQQEDAYMQRQSVPAIQMARSGELLDVVEAKVGALN